MSENRGGTHRFFVWVAFATFLFVIGALVYDGIFSGPEKGTLEYRRANNRLEDGHYDQALQEFDIALNKDPDHAPSHFGRALALMALEKFEEALEAMDTSLALEPDFAAVYANRGILNDRMGKHSKALDDYRKALSLDPTLAEGPHWLTRFLRNQYDAPPTIADRAKYLEEELAKPLGERDLVNPEKDAQQRPYKVSGTLEKER